MKAPLRLLMAAGVSLFLGISTHAQNGARSRPAHQPVPTGGAQTVNCSGKVTDAAGHPVAGATIEYWRSEGVFNNDLKLERKLTTDADGAFEFRLSHGMGFLVARKARRATAWKLIGRAFGRIGEAEVHMVMGPPTVLAGVVLDKANQPVTNAEVSVSIAVSESASEGSGQVFNYLIGKPARTCFAALTGSDGHFRIEGVPTNTTVVLSVKAPGLALPQSSGSFTAANALPWRAGQRDIRLTVEPSGSIEGKVVVKTGHPALPVARLMLQSDLSGWSGISTPEETESRADGSFHIDGVPAGTYRLRAVFGTSGTPNWVAETVPVSVTSGQTTRGVKVTAIRGGVLKATVAGSNDGKLRPNVMVAAFKQGYQSTSTSDSNGIALLRLPPGNYQLAAVHGGMPTGQVRASVAEGQTNQVEIDIIPPLHVSGVVHKPDGRPAAGLPVWLVGNYGPTTVVGKTDADGKFHLEWQPRPIGSGTMTPAVLIRDPDHNLAVAVDLDEDTHTLDLTLAPGLTLAVKTESGGKPLTNAIVRLIFWTVRSGVWLSGLSQATQSPGEIEIPALPPGRKYGVVVSAPGYGQQSINNIGASDEAGRHELEPVDLKLANLRLAGTVRDSDNKPVAGAFVHLQGNGQPSSSTRSDEEGRFVFDHVCEGMVTLWANARNATGNASAQGGDTNVVLTLGQHSRISPGATMRHLKGLVTDPEGKPVAGAQVKVFPSNGEGWIKTKSDGTFKLTWSMQSWQMQSGDALLAARDRDRNLAASRFFTEDKTNLDLQLKPALSLSGRVESADGAKLVGGEVGLWIRRGNNYEQLDRESTPIDAKGHYEITCLPPDAQYIVYASAHNHGRSQRQIENDSETNHLQLDPLILKLADRIVAGRVVDDNDKPVSGVNVSLNGEGQPNGYMTTDSKGRFHFKVCEGEIRLFASAQVGFAQASVNAGDTNIVMSLRSQSAGSFQRPHRTSLKGKPLPDLASVHLSNDAAPAGEAVLLCLFNAAERPSRHVIHVLSEQAAAFRDKNVAVVGIQSKVISDDILDAWKSAVSVEFPIGRVTTKSGDSKWASSVTALPWLILADAHHRVVAEGFSLDDLDEQIRKLR